jgi:hypothetical protein
MNRVDDESAPAVRVDDHVERLNAHGFHQVAVLLGQVLQGKPGDGRIEIDVPLLPGKDKHRTWKTCAVPFIAISDFKSSWARIATNNLGGKSSIPVIGGARSSPLADKSGEGDTPTRESIDTIEPGISTDGVRLEVDGGTGETSGCDWEDVDATVR